MPFRRVVTGDRDGRSVVISDEVVRTQPTLGAQSEVAWRGDPPPDVPNDASIDEVLRFPGPGGVWVMTWILEPGASADSGNDMVDMSSGRPGFHQTDSVDIDVVQQGTVTLELDDGKEVELHAGDVAILNGNLHAWHNRGTETVRVMVTIVGARRVA